MAVTKKIVLATSSPRRIALLQQINIPFEAVVSEVNEDSAETQPDKYVSELSRRKAESVCGKLTEDAIVIAADTIVWLDGKPLGKPKGNDSAIEMLQNLQGRMHKVFTGITFANKSRDTINFKTVSDDAEVYMRNMSNQEIYAYVATGEPFDKAGAYAIQERAAVFVEKTVGNYNSIVGLPLDIVYCVLKEFGFDLTQSWRGNIDL